MEQAAIEPNVHWPDVKWTGRFGPIANVRGGDGEAALATGHVATVTDAKSLRQPRLSDCRRPVRRGEDQGRWMATGRPQHRLATRGIRLPYNRLRFVMDEGPPVPGPSPLAGRSL